MSEESDQLTTAALAYVAGCAPQDVLSTINWLRTEGWQPQGARGGRDESFGNVAVTFVRGEAHIAIARDRGQWMLHIGMPGWKRPIDLDIILDTIAGRDNWSGPIPRPLPEQLPSGVAWKQALPKALAWLASVSDSEPVLKDMQRKRGRSLFPPPRAFRDRSIVYPAATLSRWATNHGKELAQRGITFRVRSGPPDRSKTSAWIELASACQPRSENPQIATV